MANEKKITPREVRHMARLSRLEITEDEEKLFASQFAGILGHMDLLGTVDTSGLDPLYSPIDHMAPTREDVGVNKRGREQVLANAPETDGENFIVPRIV